MSSLYIPKKICPIYLCHTIEEILHSLWWELMKLLHAFDCILWRRRPCCLLWYDLCGFVQYCFACFRFACTHRPGTSGSMSTGSRWLSADIPYCSILLVFCSYFWIFLLFDIPIARLSDILTAWYSCCLKLLLPDTPTAWCLILLRSILLFFIPIVEYSYCSIFLLLDCPIFLLLDILTVRYHCGGWPKEVNTCFLNSYMVYL
jgi:hypothetical protein